jgi:hypothetical protein
MFKKKECKRCKRKIDEKYSYCPYCGNRMYNNEEENEDWGMLGKNDFMPSMNEIKFPFGFNAIFNSLMKNMSKELSEQLNKNYFQQEENNNPKKIKKEGISISISTFGEGPPKIKVTQLGNKQSEIKEEKEKIKPDTFTKDKIKKFASLNREEPKTNIRRLSSKMIYELKMAGVKSLDDVSITKLENSIEVKAISKDKAYMKVIPINLPIINYSLLSGKLILELGIKS